MLFLLLTLVSQVTTPPVIPVIPPNTAYRIAFEAEPDAILRWWCNGAIVRNFIAADLVKGPATAGGRIGYEATVPGQAAGVYSCQVSATKLIAVGAPELWPDAKSEAIPILVGAGPLTPISLKVIVTLIK